MLAVRWGWFEVAILPSMSQESCRNPDYAGKPVLETISVKLRMFQWMLLPTLLVTANALYGWGALTQLTDLGPTAELSAKREGALTWTYMQGGRWLIERSGIQAAAVAHAELMFAPARNTLLANPALAMDVLHRAHYGFQHRLLLWSHWGAPLLWLLTAIAYVRRQKAIVSTRKLR